MRPPRFADWILKRVLPIGKRGESILGDLHEEYALLPAPRSLLPGPRSLWYWQQTLRLVVRYAASRSPQQSLSYPRSNAMWFELSSDIKTAFRGFRRTPGTSALIVLTLAFAIAAATIGFSVADLALFRGLPVDDNSKVVSIFVSDTHGSNFRARVSAPDLLDYRARSTTLEQLAGMRDGRAALIKNGQSQTLSVTYATANLFAAMGQSPLVGRLFREGEDAAGADPVAVLSHHYWRDEMGSRPDAIGRTLQIGRDMVTVIGVLSPDMEFGNLAEIDLWLPTTLNPDGARDVRNLRFMARLRENVSFEQAAAEIGAIGDALATEYPRTNKGWKVRLVPIREITGGEGFWVVIALFMLSIGLLMAIATANVSNLVMVRTLARARELAVRTALGARKGRLIRQFVTEGMLLSVIAAATSLLLAVAAMQAVRSFSDEAIFQQMNIDPHELGFVALLALICPLMFSLAPIRALSRPDLRHVLAAGGSRGATALGRGRGVLVVLQVALAVILLTVASLALRSTREMYSRPTGLETGKLLVFGLEFNDAQYPTIDEAGAAARATRDALTALPGVDSLAMVSSLPILGDQGPVMLTIDGAVASRDDAQPTAVVTGASHDVGRALGLRLLAGRWWDDGASEVAVVTAEAARRYFGGVDQAIGRRVALTQGARTVDARVIGVSSDVANTDRTELPPARIWMPLDPAARRFAFTIRSDNPAALISSVRSLVATRASAVPVEYLGTFDDALAQAASSDYVIIGMLTGFAILALVLASTGLFGVVSYAVAQRTAEFGTRMALGASAAAVVGIVARDSARLLAIGLSLGLAGGIGVGFTMKSVLFGLSPTDPLTLSGVVTLLTVVTLVATAIPAWRASRIDPVIALRSE
jgi:putative ABC transport system permease protein